MKYSIKLSFDAIDETPQVFIVDENGTEVLEVFEEPVPLTQEWSWNPYNWEPGDFAKEVVARMNA